jgi:hypothetical protein
MNTLCGGNAKFLNTDAGGVSCSAGHELEDTRGRVTMVTNSGSGAHRVFAFSTSLNTKT